jgi:DNA-binding transcriptional LysR family regulator
MEKIKLSQLEMLVATVDAGGFSAAAAELDCTQSRISHAIAELEASVGTRLLIRSRSGCMPTDVGHQVLTKARQILRLTDSIIHTVAEDNAVTGHVRIVCFRSAGAHLLPLVLEALAREYPGIQVDVDDACESYDEVIEAVRSGAAELGITRDEPQPKLISYRLAQDPYILIVPSGLRLKPPVSWEQLSDLTFVHSQNAASRMMLEICRAAGFKPRTTRKLASDSGILAMVGRGMGYTIFPHLAAYPCPKNVKVMPLPIAARRNIALIMQAESTRNKSIKIVTRFIRDKRLLTMTEAYRDGVISLGA